MPLVLARLDGVDTHCIEEGHGSTGGNGTVAEAVIELLETGKAGLLPKRRTSRRPGGFGVGNYIGPCWPVEDAPAKAFGEAFYQALMRAMPSVDWADRIHCGSPNSRGKATP